MATPETIQPYVEQLFDDSKFQRDLARAGRNFRGARSRAGRAKSKKQAVTDARMWEWLLGSAGAALDAAQALQQAPVKRKRRGRGRRLALLLGVGAAAYVATNEGARTRVLELAGQGKDTGT
jgi:hypothetical protein